MTLPSQSPRINPPASSGARSAQSMRSLIRIMGDRRELFEKTQEINRANHTFREANFKLRRDLALLTGDPLKKEP